MSYFVSALRENPELAVFLTLAAGFVLGRIKIGSFRLGTVVGTLFAGVLIGQLNIEVPATVKIIFFDLFLFATGYKVGPQFIRGLGKSAIPQVALTVVLCVTSLITALLVAKIFRYDSGTAAGLIAGAFTESTVIGTAGSAIGRLGLGEAETSRLLNNIAVAYAVTYLVGSTTTVWFLSHFAPRILGINLREAARKIEAKSSGGADDDAAGYSEWDIRAYRLAEAWVGHSVAELERSFGSERVFVEQIRRTSGLLEAEPATVLAAGDAIVLTGRRSVLAGGVPVGSEVDDRELLELPVDAFNVVLTNKSLVNRSLEGLAKEMGRGVRLLKLVREGQEIPFAPSTRLNRGDVLRLMGPTPDVERVGRTLGYIERPTKATDMVFVGVGIVLGGLLGLLSVDVGGVPLSLTASGGALIMGLIFGWLRSVHPTFGRIPEPALWVFDTVGLAVFIGLVGISAGPGFVESLRQTGPVLLLVGFFMAIIPSLVGALLGHFVMKMNPAILFGALAGAGTNTAALRAVQDAADSKVPVLGYTVPYAIGNVLLTAWGPIIVLLTR